MIGENVLLTQASNRILQHIYVSDRYLRHRHDDRRNSAKWGEASSSDTVTGLFQCNVAMQIVDVNKKIMERQLLSTSGDIGTGVDESFLDFGSFEMLLESLRNVKCNYKQMSLPPLTECVHEMLTESAEDYQCAEKSMLKKGPIKRMTELVRPYGVVSTNPNHLEYLSALERFKAVVLTHGTNVGADHTFPLNLPIDRVAGVDNLDSTHNHGQPAKLFLVVGPSDEINCGQLGDRLVERTSAREGMHVLRNVVAGPDPTPSSPTTVVDQAYAATFVFGGAGDTAVKILEDAVNRCLDYTRVPEDVTVYREVAVVRIGFVPYVGPTTFVKQPVENSIRVDNFTIDPCHEWTYGVFLYSDTRKAYLPAVTSDAVRLEKRPQPLRTERKRKSSSTATTTTTKLGPTAHPSSGAPSRSGGVSIISTVRATSPLRSRSATRTHSSSSFDPATSSAVLPAATAEIDGGSCIASDAKSSSSLSDAASSHAPRKKPKKTSTQRSVSNNRSTSVSRGVESKQQQQQSEQHQQQQQQQSEQQERTQQNTTAAT